MDIAGETAAAAGGLETAILENIGFDVIGGLEPAPADIGLQTDIGLHFGLYTGLERRSRTGPVLAHNAGVEWLRLIAGMASFPVPVWE